MDLVELTFKDQYIGRGDMWRLKKSLVSPLPSLCRVEEITYLFLLLAVKENKHFTKYRKLRMRPMSATLGNSCCKYYIRVQEMDVNVLKKKIVPSFPTPLSNINYCLQH